MRKEERSEKKLNTIQLHHDNPRRLTSCATSQVIVKMGWSVVPHPLCCPDLTPCDLHLFGTMEGSLRGQGFDDPEDVNDAIKLCLMQSSHKFLQKGFEKWVQPWRKCISSAGDYHNVDEDCL